VIRSDSGELGRPGLAARRIRELDGHCSQVRMLMVGKGSDRSARYWARVEGGSVFRAMDVIEMRTTGTGKRCQHWIRFLGDGFGVSFNGRRPTFPILTCRQFAAKWGGWEGR